MSAIINDRALHILLRRDRTIVIAALGALTALAWGYTIWLTSYMNRMDMGEMSAGTASMMQMGMGTMLAPAVEPVGATHFIVLVAMWSVMMIGMMTPSVAPMILLYARVGRQAALRGEPLAATSIFAGGYLLAWLGFSIFAAAGQILLEQAALLTPLMKVASHSLGGLVLIAAGLYQWMPVKDSCLRHCQSPLAFLQRHGGFQRDPLRSLYLGLRHGFYCVGCCWALMAILFVGGVMNVLWIALLMIFVLLEKVVVQGSALTRIAGLGLIAWGALLIAFGDRLIQQM